MISNKVSYEDRIANEIIKELCQPANIDLLVAVRDLGSESPDESFMFGFTNRKPMSFDDFCMMSQVFDNEVAPHLGIEPDYRNSSVRFDEYLKSIDEHNATVPLCERQTERFNAIVDKHNDGGWSGSFYGFLMRKVQFMIVQMWSN